jgi:predicted nucleic acid-binding protein
VRYLVDTPVLLDHFAGRISATALIRRLLDEGGEPLTCEVVVSEIASITPGNLEARIATLLDGLRYVAVDREMARAAGELRRRASVEGMPLPLADALIVAAATAEDARIVSRGRPGLVRPGNDVLSY